MDSLTVREGRKDGTHLPGCSGVGRGLIGERRSVVTLPLAGGRRAVAVFTGHSHYIFELTDVITDDIRRRRWHHVGHESRRSGERRCPIGQSTLSILVQERGRASARYFHPARDIVTRLELCIDAIAAIVVTASADRCFFEQLRYSPEIAVADD